jgi:hypothetical protein
MPTLFLERQHALYLLLVLSCFSFSLREAAAQKKPSQFPDNIWEMKQGRILGRITEINLPTRRIRLEEPGATRDELERWYRVPSNISIKLDSKKASLEDLEVGHAIDFRYHVTKTPVWGVAYRIEVYSVINVKKQEIPTPPPPKIFPSVLNVNDPKVGDTGIVTSPLTIVSIHDDNNMIVMVDDPDRIPPRVLWVKGVPTYGKADREEVKLDGWFTCTGTKPYIARGNVKSTVKLIEPESAEQRKRREADNAKRLRDYEILKESIRRKNAEEEDKAKHLIQQQLLEISERQAAAEEEKKAEVLKTLSKEHREQRAFAKLGLAKYFLKGSTTDVLKGKSRLKGIIKEFSETEAADIARQYLNDHP